MDYKEKYKEALERAKAGKPMDEVFPQLKESEDERIRRTLVEYFGPEVQLDFVRGVQIQKIRDWLKSLRPQPQRRNTYYDIIHGILDTLKDIDFMKITPEHRVSLLNDIRVKCKNADECSAILDEPHWKPTAEHLSALSDVLEESKGSRLAVLKDLYNHIKEV